MENPIRISGREKQILRLLINEKKGHEISKHLGISEKTVGTYKLRLLEKIGAKTVIGLYLWNQVNKFVDVESQKFEEVNVKSSKSRFK
jgi:DNA-binding CsgD family transcriptional regulator